MKTVSFCLMALIALTGTVQAQGLGTLKGQFILDGEFTPLPPLHEKGADVKDAAVCSAEAVLNQTIVVDPQSKGVQNVFIYLRKAPEGMPAALKTPAQKEVKFDQKNCTFVPHAMTVQVGQTVQVLSDDNAAHNTHSWPIRNQPFNFFMKANDRKGVPVNEKENNIAQPEIIPTKITCDIHPWMTAYWMILDHPYMAVSDAQGNFEIKDLPPGEHSFYIWQESKGYVDRAFKVTVEAGKVTDAGQVKVKLN